MTATGQLITVNEKDIFCKTPLLYSYTFILLYYPPCKSLQQIPETTNLVLFKATAAIRVTYVSVRKEFEFSSFFSQRTKNSPPFIVELMSHGAKLRKKASKHTTMASSQFS